MSDVGWLFVAFLVVWAGIGGYIATIHVRQARLERQLSALVHEQQEGSTNARH